MTEPRDILFIAADRLQALDLFGPLEAFAAANQIMGVEAYRWQVAALGGPQLRSESGIAIAATTTPAALADAALPASDTIVPDTIIPDTIIIVGGCGPRCYLPDAAEIAWLRALAPRARRIASVCTGAFLLARLGLADGRRVVTHWDFQRELAAAFPALDAAGDALFVRDGPVWSSAGVTAGIDMSMAMIAEDLGEAVAGGVARELVVYLRRPGGQAQFSEPLKAQNIEAGRLTVTLRWIADNLALPLDVDSLAAHSAMSPRHFSRQFRKATGVSPARYVERLRLDRARTLLCEPGARISQVALAVGFANADSFRRAFERQFSVSPSAYRDRFTAPLPAG